MRTIIIINIICLLTLMIIACEGEDVTGKIEIEYSGGWSAEITENQETTELNGSGNWEKKYKNPDILKATVKKDDTTDSKLILYIYEDGRIVRGVSTREQEGSVTVEYEFPF